MKGQLPCVQPSVASTNSIRASDTSMYMYIFNGTWLKLVTYGPQINREVAALKGVYNVWSFATWSLNQVSGCVNKEVAALHGDHCTQVQLCIQETGGGGSGWSYGEYLRITNFLNLAKNWR